jgi:hypothetical protein
MLRKLFLIATCAALLAACGGNKTNTATPAQQNAAPTATTVETATPPPEALPTNGPRQYSEGTDEVQLPQTGTIVPSSDQDPDAGTLFDSVALNRTGGVAGKELNVALSKDGTLIRDGVTSTISADQVKQISAKLDQLGFFGMQGIFQSPGASADVYVYRISAERNGNSKRITMQEGLIPPQLSDLIQALSQLGTTP